MAPIFTMRLTGHRLIDLYGFFGSAAGRVQPSAFRPARSAGGLLRAAKIKVANSDVYSEAYAKFVETFERVVAPLPPLESLFLHRRRRARGRERAQGRDGLEGAQEHGRRPRRTRHGDPAFPSRLPRAQRLHHEPDEYRSAQDGSLRQVPLAARFHSVDRFLAAGARARSRRHRAGEKIRSGNHDSSRRSAASTSPRSSSSRSRAKAATIISAANCCRRSAGFATRTRCCSSSTKCSAAWASPAGTGAASISACCPTCWPSARRRRSAA